VTSATTVKKRVVERYIEGFRAGDHEMILARLNVAEQSVDTARLVTYQVDRQPTDQTRRAFGG
jgi:hypothetical protein